MIDFVNFNDYVNEVLINGTLYSIIKEGVDRAGIDLVKGIDISLFNEYKQHYVIDFFECVSRIDNDLYLREDISEEDKNFMKQANEEYTKKFNAPLFKNSEILDTLQKEASWQTGLT